MKHKSYLALGDSYTIGESLPESGRWPVQLVQELKEKELHFHPPQIIAKTGWTTDELMNGIKKSKTQESYEMVSLSIGVNNQYRGRSLENFKTEFSQLLDLSIEFANQQPESVFVLSIPDWSNTPFAKDRDTEKVSAEIMQFNAEKNHISSEKGVCFVDITPFTMKANLNPEYLAKDGLHYSAKMHKIWVHEIMRSYFNINS